MAIYQKPGRAAAIAGLPDFGVFLHVRDGAPDLALQMAGFERDEYDDTLQFSIAAGWNGRRLAPRP